MRSVLGDAITVKRETPPPCSLYRQGTAFLHCWRKDLPIITTKSKFILSFLHLQSKCFFPLKANIFSVYVIIKENCDLVAQCKNYVSHERYRKREVESKSKRKATAREKGGEGGGGGLSLINYSILFVQFPYFNWSVPSQQVLFWTYLNYCLLSTKMVRPAI